MRPALAAGRSVVSDRSVWSTLAYQGYGRGLDLEDLRRINDWAVDGLWPDRVSCSMRPTDVLAGAHHAAATSTASSSPAPTSTRRVADGFRAMAAADPEHWTVVDAAGDAATVAARVRAALGELVP